jgi:predicted transcriptional regulator of viral defense system
VKTSGFLATHPVFTAEEFRRFLEERGSSSKWTRKALLAHHEDQGRVLRIRRGLYASVPPGSTPNPSNVDPHLVAAKLTTDAVLGYHTALEFYGWAYSVYQRFYYLTRRRSIPLRFGASLFRSVQFPKALVRKQQEHFAVSLSERAGLRVRVTSPERTLVDVFDRPRLGGGWEEIWRSLGSVEYFDLGRVVEYALLLSNSTTTAKVGFFLERHREALMVEESHLRPLRERCPRQPHYMERSAGKKGRLIREWNLVVPNEILEQSWEETL